VTANRALVLGGGGLAGIAWEIGILLGIADESPAVAETLLTSDVLIGTSAGSTVAAQISSGCGLDELFARQVAEDSAELDPGVGVDDIIDLFLAAMAEPDLPGKRRRIGAAALAAQTVAEPVRRAVIAHRLPSHAWPDRVLRLTAVDTETGELAVLERDSGAQLVDAVAASCAVPGAWPPVTIGGRCYMDGGIGSSINLTVADDCDAVVVLVPAGASTPSPFGAGPAAEISAFSCRSHARPSRALGVPPACGGRVGAGVAGAALGVFADAESLAAFGSNALDPRCRAASALAGRAQGRREAAAVAVFLNGLLTG
jgi:NTE family protein